MTATNGPFVGRTRLLRDVLTRVTSGGHVVLYGPAGVGKTRLVAEICGQPPIVRRRIDRLLGGTGRGSAFHLGTLASLGLPDDVAPDNLAAVHTWFLRRWQRRRNHDAPALVWLDDAQHVDPLSAVILRHAVVSGVVQLVATHRTPEPLDEALTALRVEGITEHIAVPPLQRADADRVARHAAQEDLDDETLESIHRLAAGNPLFTRELASSSARGEPAGTFHDVEGVVGLPVTHLPPSPRRTLELVAVAEPAPQQLLGPRYDDVRELRRRGLLVPHENETLQVDHPLRRAWVLQDLGPGRLHVVQELLDLVAHQDLEEHLDPVILVAWELEAGRAPPAERLEKATRVAISRRDGRTALRFARHLPGERGRLLHGQALIVGGDLGQGLDELVGLSASSPSEVRVEAAFWAARYLGVMLGDYERAEAVLDAVDGPDVAPEQQRHLLAARLWLFVVGAITDLSVLDRAVHLLETAPHDQTTTEIAIATASVLCHVRTPGAADPLVRGPAFLDDGASRNDEARCRARCVEGWWRTARGDATTALGVVRTAFDQAMERGDLESACLAAGNGGLLAGAAGRVSEALSMARRMQDLSGTADWFQYRNLAEAVHLGNLCLAGRSREVPAIPSPLSEEAVRGHPDVYPLLLARARHLHEQATGGTPKCALLQETLERLAGHRKHLWVALVGAETTSLSTHPDVHRVLLSSSRQVPAPGIVAVAAQVARARLERDPAALLRAGQDLEWSGLIGPASRVMADVGRLVPGSAPQGRAARAALLRLRRSWDGGHLWWLDDVEDLPSVRQTEVAWKVAEGASAADVAEELCLSRRTVENHLHRVYRTLGVSGRDELTTLLRGPKRPARWQPGLAPADVGTVP